MAKQTAVDWLSNLIDMQFPSINIKWKEWMIDRAKQMEKKQMIGFHRWMMENDKEENAERFFHYSDEDMLNEYLKQNA